jgi:hypothetical protein
MPNPFLIYLLLPLFSARPGWDPKTVSSDPGLVTAFHHLVRERLSCRTITVALPWLGRHSYPAPSRRREK